MTARGFNGLYANKLLVLIDGRSVYNVTYSGVHWDTVDMPLEDIDRIEVIRGPGAALWGANAVNGVINIITKPARETQGGCVSVGMGSHERGAVSGQFGGQLGAASHYRVSTKIFSRRETGVAAHDDWRAGHVSARLDTRLTEADALVASGSWSRAEMGQNRLLLGGVTPGSRRH